MPLNPKVLRRLFAAGAVLVLLIVAGFYFRGILRVHRELSSALKKIPSNITQSTRGFTFSKSEGGRTLFTIHASQAEQFKEGGRAELHDVNIVVYGRQSNRFDQIYGSDFQYDPSTGEIVANGEVHIDLESDATGISRPDQSPPREMKNPIHLKTSNLSFNNKTGFAQTKERIEFRIPEASGSAMGAAYDSRSNVLKLLSAVRVVTTDKRQATITAQSATMSKDPRTAVLQSARLEEQERDFRADKVTFLLRDDNTIERVLAAGNIHAQGGGPRAFSMDAPQAELIMADQQQIRSGTIFGGVSFETKGTSPAKGKAGKVLLTFGPRNQVIRARAEDSVQLDQGQPGKSMQVQSQGLDLFTGSNKKLEKAVTSGTAQVVLTDKQTKSTITAGTFEANYGPRSKLQRVFGSPDAKVVSSTPGQPDRITTSRDVMATFNDEGSMTLVEQDGNFHYQEGQRTATAAQARYVPSEDNFVLTGSPRVQETGTSLSADTIQLNRKTNNATAQGNVKTTYTELKPQSNGALLASADPIHVTGSSMQASRNGGVARFTNARLWQAANIIEAPIISFDREHRSLQAQGSAQGKVSAVFVQPDKNGKTTPVNVTADKLSYVDAERKAVFSGNVLVRGAETTMNADTVQVLLLPRGNQASSQLDRIIAQGEITIQQQERKATGNQLVYTAQDEKFVLTAADGKRPSIFDAEHGQITGDSLTFYTHDDRVLVDSKESSHTLIQTRIRDASKK
ncbi:MAG: LPS export ABC transporter periplasmic protein LptC [Candidatus Angelobacter sp. Gp1-AA117]|nr:MAG: LPS export ABC transporter periplasmic protein LptC [Candidatus Angelobacter sp. Gp1-AA117]